MKSRLNLSNFLSSKAAVAFSLFALFLHLWVVYYGLFMRITPQQNELVYQFLYILISGGMAFATSVIIFQSKNGYWAFGFAFLDIIATLIYYGEGVTVAYLSSSCNDLVNSAPPSLEVCKACQDNWASFVRVFIMWFVAIQAGSIVYCLSELARRNYESENEIIAQKDAIIAEMEANILAMRQTHSSEIADLRQFYENAMEGLQTTIEKTNQSILEASQSNEQAMHDKDTTLSKLQEQVEALQHSERNYRERVGELQDKLKTFELMQIKCNLYDLSTEYASVSKTQKSALTPEKQDRIDFLKNEMSRLQGLLQKGGANV